MFDTVHQPIIVGTNCRRSSQKPDFGQRAHTAATRVSSRAAPVNSITRVVFGFGFHMFQIRQKFRSPTNVLVHFSKADIMGSLSEFLRDLFLFTAIVILCLAVYISLIPPFMIFIGGGPVPRECRNSTSVFQLLVCMETRLFSDLVDLSVKHQPAFDPDAFVQDVKLAGNCFMNLLFVTVYELTRLPYDLFVRGDGSRLCAFANATVDIFAAFTDVFVRSKY